MARMKNKQCPLFKSDCLVEKCGWFDERMDNCAIHIFDFNLYKLAMALESLRAEKDPAPSGYPRRR